MFQEWARQQTLENNTDNISRTKAYLRIYEQCKELKWALLASMVSRNAGWNMTDLETMPIRTLLGMKERNMLFKTYERANWLIFSDAYPQLLTYMYSKKTGKPQFHHLTYFHVSTFMKHEWFHFFTHKDEERLVKALIINEQNVIQQPVIAHPEYREHVFHRLPYLSQDFFHLSAVLFPTMTGQLYGYSVNHFSNVTERIKLGKKLASLLFHPDYYPKFYRFSKDVEPTGARWEYEKYFSTRMPKTPMLRLLYPIYSHQDTIRKDWYVSDRSVKKRWWKDELHLPVEDVSHKFYSKRHLLYAWVHFKHVENEKDKLH
ncbi:DUF2515 family protein [Pontibacillus halophilus]|uniref:DUF2515 family protein n=1 Tax=Pontibacillus halophilus TaxID=516704 RepID=UPI00042462B2|nr:DUF2515 family protein [Pontibacillus halophilus]